MYEDEKGVTRIDTKRYPGEIGLTLELCAGIMDKDHTPEEIAQMELMEECGYKVPLESLRKISTFK